MDEDAERTWILARAPAARRRHEARVARLAREAGERQAREQVLVQQAASEDAVEAAIARALARRKGPA